MATFTTWSALLTEIKNDLASGSWKAKSYTVDGMERQFRDIDEVLKFYRFVERQGNAERSTPVGRTCAGQGGRG